MISLDYYFWITIIAISICMIIFGIVFPFVIYPDDVAHQKYEQDIANMHCIDKSFFEKNLKYCNKYGVSP